MSSVKNLVSTLCNLAGITSYFKTLAFNASIALLIANPTVALSGFLTVWVAKFSANKYSEK